MSRIIVKNLPDKITQEKLKQLFSEKGVVTDVQLKFTKDGKFRKFAFIGFQKPEMAEAAKDAFNKSFINTSQIQVETCAELGDPNKPRPWSKYAPENLKRLHSDGNKAQAEEPKGKIKKSDKQKIKDPEVMKLLENHKDDSLFTQFMEVNIPDLSIDFNLDKKDSEEIPAKKTKKIRKGGSDSEDEEDDDNNEEEVESKDSLANKDISDSEYIKLKTGVNLNLKEPSSNSDLKSKSESKYKELFTIKIKGLPVKVKKRDIKEFLSPLKPYTIRRAMKMIGIFYCGFTSEKDMKKAVLKNRSFFNGKRVTVKAVRKANSGAENEMEKKWRKQNEKLKGLETVAESGRIFIRNLTYTVTEEDLKEKFEKYGPITEMILPIDSFTRKVKGFAIVTYLIPEHACRAFNELDGTIFQGRMLHLLPALPNSANDEDEINPDDPFKKKKLKKEKAKSGSSVNWNTFFVGENALAEAMASTYNTTKEKVLDDKQGGAAVRLALGETQLVSKMKQFLEENDVHLEAFENMSACIRSKTVILVKNLPFGTKAEEIREKFCNFGVLKRVILPPSGVAALVEFIEPSEAKVAFRRLSYSKFKHVPMYLEWAPEKVFGSGSGKETDGKKDDASTAEKVGEEKAEPEEKEEILQQHIPVEGSTIFVKNLNFSTRDDGLRQHFSSCGTLVSATVAMKMNPKEPGKKLSMGYGFVEFTDKESADKALKTLQFTTLDDHRIELKRSNRTLASSVTVGGKTKSSQKPNTKILVRNVPFQANQKEISDLFKVFGEIKAIRLPKKMTGTGSHRGFCFVEYNTIHDAKRAFVALSQSVHLYGRRLVLEWAAADDDVETLREKTAQQFNAGAAENTGKKKNIAIEEDDSNDEE